MSPSHHLGLTLSPQSREIYILGYSVRLTDSELALLLSIMQSPCGASADELRLIVSSNSVSVHIHNINEKVRSLTGRSLIVCKNGRYMVSDEI